jgi:hypothetical protein
MAGTAQQGGGASAPAPAPARPSPPKLKGFSGQAKQEFWAAGRPYARHLEDACNMLAEHAGNPGSVSGKDVRDAAAFLGRGRPRPKWRWLQQACAALGGALLAIGITEFVTVAGSEKPEWTTGAVLGTWLPSLLGTAMLLYWLVTNSE